MRLAITICLVLLLPLSLLAGDFEEGQAAENAGGFKRAVELYRKAAEQGNAAAQLFS
ncbi:MAG: hypothetical protein HQM09_19970 [Candidatus Riflebacteria bacterium]|nr:hypothetical protein [Candidatus Riflebacteria bacterium]